MRALVLPVPSVPACCIISAHLTGQFLFLSVGPGFDFVGLIENGNWKSVGTTRGKNVPGAARFAQLDEYLEREKKGAVDSLMLSTVVGVVKI